MLVCRTFFERRSTIDDVAELITPPDETMQTRTVLYIVLLIATVVAVDVLLFRNQFWGRLTVNVGIVLVFSAFYFRFLKRP